MKKLMTLALLLVSLNALSTEILLKTYRYDHDIDYAPEFEVNKELQRAWVNIVEEDSDWEDTRYTDDFVKVDGLTLIGSDIVYKDTTCAVVYTRGRWIFRGDVIKMTRDCQFVQKEVVRAIDDGFYIRNVKLVEVYLKIND